MIDNIRAIIGELVRDRAVQLGTGSSSLSIAAAERAKSVPPDWMSDLTPYITFYALVVGALSATATLVYIALKIRRIVKHPTAPVD